MKAHDMLVAALKLAEEALYNVPEVGKKYDQQHSDTHLRATLAIQDALKQAAVVRQSEQAAIRSLLSEVEAHLDYEADEDMESAANDVRERMGA